MFRNYKTARLLIGVPILLGVLILAVIFLAPVLRVGKDLLFGPVGVFSVVKPSASEIKSTNGRTNILLLGTGGASHDGPNLSDTIIVASIKTVFGPKETPEQFPVVLISVPRDIYLDSLNGKINTAYAQGTEKGNGAGLTLAKGAVAEIVGLPIHYAVRLDFSGFVQAVDVLGGVDINVMHAFTDNQYPLEGKETDSCGFSPQDVATISASIDPESPFTCRYERLHFDAGMQHMDGATALKFVRSRHAIGNEGTDFARSKRQQLVISAIKDKIFSSDTLLHPDKFEKIYNVIKSHIDTDVDPGQVNNLVQLAVKYRGAKIISAAIDTNLLDNPPVDERGWILLPKGGNWEQVHKFVKDELMRQSEVEDNKSSTQN